MLICYNTIMPIEPEQMTVKLLGIGKPRIKGTQMNQKDYEKLRAENIKLKKHLKHIEDWLHQRCTRDLRLAAEPSLYDLSFYVKKARRE